MSATNDTLGLSCMQVAFVATGNNLSEVPPPLLDRLEVITLPGYTLNEKVAIAEVRHLDERAKRSQLSTCAVGACLSHLWMSWSPAWMLQSFRVCKCTLGL